MQVFPNRGSWSEEANESAKKPIDHPNVGMGGETEHRRDDMGRGSGNGHPACRVKDRRDGPANRPFLPTFPIKADYITWQRSLTDIKEGLGTARLVL